MAVDQRGVHLLEFRTRNVLNSFEYDSILDYTPSLNHMLLITGTDKKQSKIIVNTNQVNLIKDTIFLVFSYLAETISKHTVRLTHSRTNAFLCSDLGLL